MSRALTVGTAVTVRVPATSANLGPGFDCLGLALGLADEVRVEVTGGGLDVAVTGEGAEAVARDESHLVVQALRTGLAARGAHAYGLRLDCRNAIPHGRGLGSSAAAICAGLVAARALAEGAPGPDLALATALEGHPDNVAACLGGGLVLSSAEGPQSWSLPLRGDLEPVVLLPAATRQSTEAARALLPAQLPHAVAARAVGRAALLVSVLAGSGDAADLLAATADELHQPYRLAAQPEGAALLSELRALGVPVVLSGSGPTLLALALDAEAVAVVTARGLARGWRVLTPGIDTCGGTVLP